VTRIYPTLEASAVRQRAAALARYSEWERGHETSLAPADALSGVALLFELLPPPSRTRPLCTDGVQRMHHLLSVLGRPPG
jgi:hypothetical protein